MINESSFYIPFKNPKEYAKGAYDYALKNDLKIQFNEIPFCVFGTPDRSHIKNKISVPELGNSQPPKEVRSEKRNVPTYRLKKKLEMCEECQCRDFCDGFFVNDVEKYGTGQLEPL